MPTHVRSFCKINLGLAVGPLRESGFHGLTTMYQTLALHDIVTVTAERSSSTRITLTTNHPNVPTDGRNTAWKMTERALSAMSVAADVNIHIQKQLPVQGGLGAGSANAVAALLGLEKELGLAIPKPDRLQLAEGVGSDVPLFLIGGTVVGVDRGQEVYPLPDLPAIPCVVAIPGVGVSTKLAFEALDKRESGELTSGASEGRLKQLSRALAAVWTTTGAEAGVLRGTTGIAGENNSLEGDLAENPLLALVRTGIANDFEKVAFAQHPFLRSTKRDLLGDGHPGDPGTAVYAALSGSGSALFGLYRNQADACAAQQRVQSTGMQAILTETLPREMYWASMFAE